MRPVFIHAAALIAVCLSGGVYAQVAINADNSASNSSAMLDVKSTSRGMLAPRMTYTQIRAISSPPEGLVVYNTTIQSICWYEGSAWIAARDLDSLPCGTVVYGGKTYNGVIVGMQCWMKENLDIGLVIPGSENQTNNSVIEKYCYNNELSNCALYGGFYQWNEMMQYNATPGGRGICPLGWHVPSDGEWTILTDYLGGLAVAGGKMKETGTSHWLSPNTGATNSSGFSALPSGYRDITGGFIGLTHNAFFWSSTASGNVYTRLLGYDYEQVYRNFYQTSFGFSCRCLKD